MKIPQLTSVIVAALCLGAVSAQGAIYEFQQGVDSYAGTTDNRLMGGGWATYNQGGTTSLAVGGFNNSTPYRSVLRFDLSSLAGLTIQSATLELTATGVNGTYTDNLVTLHVLHATNAGWIEGSSTAFTSNNSAATWNWAGPDTNAWKDAGGNSLTSFAGQPYGAAVANFLASSSDSTGTTKSVGFSSLIFIQDWVNNPSQNAGLAIISTQMEPTTNSQRNWNFASSENGTIAYRPKLIVVTVPVPEPASLALLGLGGLLLLPRRRGA